MGKPGGQLLRSPVVLVGGLMLALFVVCLPVSDPIIDPIIRVRAARAIQERGTLDIAPEPTHMFLTPKAPNGAHYSVYGLGQPLLLVPLDAVAGVLSGAAGQDAAARLALREVLLAWLYYFMVNGLLALAVFGVLRRLRLSRRSSALGTLCVFVTSLWLIWSRTMQEETLAALLLVGALYFGLGAARGRRFVLSALAVGTLLGYLANVRYNGALTAAAVMVWIIAACPDWRTRLKLLALATAALLPWLGVVAWHNILRFGSMTETGYQAYGELVGRTWSFRVGDFIKLSVGGDFGTLWFALPLLLLPAMFMRKGTKALKLGAAALVAATLAHMVFLSGFYMLNPSGHFGFCGPRYLAHNLVPPAIAAFIGARALWRGARRNRPWARPVTATVLALGLLVQGAGAMLQAEVENYQETLAEVANAHLADFAGRIEADDPQLAKAVLARWRTSPPQPRSIVLRRMKNLILLPAGELYHATLPRYLSEHKLFAPDGDFRLRTACDPYFLPWRLPREGLAVEGPTVLPSWMITAGSILWWLGLGSAAGLATLLALRLLGPRAR